MENFEFYNPTKVLFGKETISQIGSILQSHLIQRVMLLAGGGSIKQNQVYQQVVRSLSAAGIQWCEHWGVRPNPVLSSVQAAIQEAREFSVQAILAVGGGSVIDSAKAIAGGCCMEDVWDAFCRKAAIEKALPIFVVLTLSATGSEMNSFTVITKEDEKKKWATGSPALFPQVSIIDPSVQAGLPWHQTVNGGLDAIAHILEFYFLGTTEEATIALNESLIRTILKAVDQLQAEPSCYEARANLAWAATLALNGIGGAQLKGGDWCTHMMEHGVSAIHPEVAHGTGLGILFPSWIRFMEPFNPLQFKRWAKQIWNSDSLEQGIQRMQETLKRWKAPTSLRDIGISESEISIIADNIWLAAPLGRLHPLSYQEVIEILKMAY